MSMPKGHKSSHGYATVTQGGMGFREIAEKMTEDGDKMNHATVRNILIRGLSKIAGPLSELHGIEKGDTENSVLRLASDPRFQSAIRDLMELKR
jgi:hypothetical protein